MSRELVTTLVTNPTEENLAGYLTAIDPSIVACKQNDGPSIQRLRICELDGDQSPSWVSRYSTGLNRAEVIFKQDISSGGVTRYVFGDSFSSDDLGPLYGIPPSIARKTITTDLAPVECEIVTGASFDPNALPPGVDFVAQGCLYPGSSRHLLKSSDGTIHVLTNFVIDNILRVVYLTSNNGGVSWTAELVDNNDGMDYVTPSLTLDKTGGVHLVYCRYDKFTSYFFGLWEGADTPYGWELMSGAGGLTENRCLVGWDTSGVFGYDDHDHSSSGSQEQYGGCSTCWGTTPPETASGTPCGGHSTLSIAIGVASHLPTYRSLKAIRYPGLPVSLPAGLILPFSSLPAGWTRYSAQDNYYIRCMSSAGLTGGSLTPHIHSIVISGMSGRHGNCVGHAFNEGPNAVCSHNHPDINDSSNSAAHTPPSHGVILGKLDANSTVLPASTLCLLGQVPGASGFTSLSGVGETLYQKALVGSASFADLGGNLVHLHSQKTFTSGYPSGGRIISNDYPSNYIATTSHRHRYYVSLDEETNWPACVALKIYRANQAIDCTKFGRVVFYRYKPKGGEWTAPVDISGIASAFHCIYPTILADSSDNLHVMWAQGNLNATPANKRIRYKKRTNGVWGGGEDVTTADLDYHYPSFDLDSEGRVHSVFFEETGCNHLQYRQRSAEGIWGSIEDVDTSDYVGWPSNVVVDSLGRVHISYAKFASIATKISEVLYRVRSELGVWSSAINLTPSKAASGYSQLPGQLTLDNKSGLTVTFSGSGYAPYSDKFHPAFRYIKPDGTISPSVDNDPVVLFPDNDMHIVNPSIFWHLFPKSIGIYQNLNVAGVALLYLKNIRGAYNEQADIVFYSSENALTGDIDQMGKGGSGSGKILGDVGIEGGAGGQSVLKQVSCRTIVKGAICKSKLNSTNLVGSSLY